MKFIYLRLEKFEIIHPEENPMTPKYYFDGIVRTTLLKNGLSLPVNLFAVIENLVLPVRTNLI